MKQIKSPRSTRDGAALRPSLIYGGMFARCAAAAATALSYYHRPSRLPLSAATLRHKAPLLCAIKAATRMAIHPSPLPPPPSHAQCTLQREAPTVVLLLCKTYQSRISDHPLMWNCFLVYQRKKEKGKIKGSHLNTIRINLASCGKIRIHETSRG